MRRNFWLGLCLAIITLAAFWPVGGMGYIDLDDWDYVAKNPIVQSGLNFKSIAWAFTSGQFSNWHPLTWLSLMLDCQFFGPNPHEEHWVNLGLHIANSWLIFLWLLQMTGTRWRSFLVAALFACHPLHIQSVAWISERKDVLSAFFGMLTLMAYTRYISKKSAGGYILTLFLFALGLMAKPMLVTLPIVMLLLDNWPLKRFDFSQMPSISLQHLAAWKPLLSEKIPFCALCLASSIVTFWAQHRGESVVAMQELPWSTRVLHAILSYSLYLEKLFWPVNLAVFYPYTHFRLMDLIFLLVVPIAFSVFILWQGRARPWLAVGWSWFIVMLIPVNGLVQVGIQTVADRYMYLPSIGLILAFAWALEALAGKPLIAQLPGIANTDEIGALQQGLGTRRAAMVGLAAIVTIACIADTRYQLRFWKDELTLFQHVIDVSPENDFLGYCYLGNAQFNAGNFEEAAKDFTTALALEPDYREARENLGKTLLQERQFQSAETQFRLLCGSNPAYPIAHKLLGVSLVEQERDAEALVEFKITQASLPNDPDVPGWLTTSEQRAEIEQTLAILIQQQTTHSSLSNQLRIAEGQRILGDYAPAVASYQKALRLDPDSVDTLNNLAWLLATCPDASVRNGPQAVKLAKHACELTNYKKTFLMGTLAAAYAEAGQFEDAVDTAQKACTNAKYENDPQLLLANQQLLELYRKHQPYREKSTLSG